jgi:hypothetical protein
LGVDETCLDRCRSISKRSARFGPLPTLLGPGLVASEPDLINPVAMHIDEKGRFWVTESLEYPRRSAGPGQDRVKVIEIGDDGKAKKVTTDPK